METNFSVYQEVFLRSRIRSEIMRLDSLVRATRLEGIESSMLVDNILDLKRLYRKLFDEFFRMYFYGFNSYCFLIS